MQEVIVVENVKCGGCVKSIQTVLSKISGITHVSVDVATGTVNIEGDDVERDVLVKTLNALGFPEKDEI
jgi:copper chaperone CopZ